MVSNLFIQDVTEIRLENVDSSKGVVWRKISIRSGEQEGPFEITLFGRREDLQVKQEEA